MILKRLLTNDEESNIDKLNIAVITALNNRKQYLDSKMDLSIFNVGDSIFDSDTGNCLGVVASVKRNNRDSYLGVFDSTLDLDIKYITKEGDVFHTQDWPNTNFSNYEDERKKLGLDIGIDVPDLSNIINKE